MIILLKQISVIRKYLERLMTSALNIHIYQRTGIHKLIFLLLFPLLRLILKKSSFIFFWLPLSWRLAGRLTHLARHVTCPQKAINCWDDTETISTLILSCWLVKLLFSFSVLRHILILFCFKYLIKMSLRKRKI